MPTRRPLARRRRTPGLQQQPLPSAGGSASPTTGNVSPGNAHTGTALRVNEIFYSIQGESSRTGIPTVFVRLTGCPMRCVYCDTAYAFHEGEKLDLETVLERVREFGVPHVTVTGGEPLAQKNCWVFLRRLCDEGFEVSLETGGGIDIGPVDPRVARILDVKTPDSGEAEKNLPENIELLGSRDEVKFVICSRADYEWSRDFLRREGLDQRCTVLFSPCYERLPAKELAEWILEDRLPVRLQVQLHKYLWGDVRGR